MFKIPFRRDGRALHDSGYGYIKNKDGSTYDVLTLEIKKKGERITTIAIDIEKDGWINLFLHDSNYQIKKRYGFSDFGLFYEVELH